MNRVAAVLMLMYMVVFCGTSYAAAQKAEPENFLYTSSGELSQLKTELSRPDIAGVQILYTWKSLEHGKGDYDFSDIENDLQIVTAMHKKLFIQIQDRFFAPDAKRVPNYLMKDPIYGGGIAPQRGGWEAQQWNPNVRLRYQKLLQALAKQFDGKAYGVNLPETAIDIDIKHDKTGFSCNKYFDAELENMKVARDAFKKSYVVQYVNFWPCEWNNDHKYMSQAFDYAVKNNIGLGGPDVIPYRKGQMENSYPFFHAYKDKLALIAVAVQEPDLTFTNPKTGKLFTKSEFQTFAGDYLGAKIIFWATSSPWLTSK